MTFEVFFDGKRTDSRGRRAYARRSGSYNPWIRISVVKAERMLRSGRAIELNNPKEN